MSLDVGKVKRQGNRRIQSEVRASLKGSSPGRVIQLGLGREFNCYLIVI